MDFDFTLPGLRRPESSRPKRVAEAIQHEFAVLLRQKVADPRLASVAVSHVTMSPDLKLAKVFFTVTEKSSVTDAKKALIKAKGFFRSHLAKALNLRYTPDIHFHYDSQSEEIERIDELFRQLEQEKKDENT
ncbi:30S ribosome-binding factor RbfA [Desulfogranum japonicum]|uniref:30S ribosome-binding factor RbfA n=1 Tax=Desulfogranum japonicum TaxID=231447 RepID=UPI000401B018|nr:30S ribosome-binding factor RbfA [Desulfogranum japonicum]